MLFVEAIFASKKEAVCCEVPAHFRSSLPARFTKRFLGAFSLLMHPKTKMSAVKFRQILKVFSMQTLWKSSWRNFTINASKNKAVCREVQTHFGSFLRASFIKTFLGAFSHFWHPQTKLFAVKFRRILEVLRLQGLWKKLWRIFIIYAPQNEAVCFEVHTHFASSLPVRFTEKVMGVRSRFMRAKTKLFAAKFRPTSEVLHLQGLQKKVLGPFSQLVCLTNKHSWLQHFAKNVGHILQFCMPINLCCVVRTHSDVLDFHIL